MGFDTLRDDIVWTVKYALWRNRKLWPKQQRKGEGLIDRLQPLAEHVVQHILASRFEINKLPPKRRHGGEERSEKPDDGR